MPKDGTTQQAAKRPALGLSEDVILDALYRYHYLTARQACRLLYKPGSLSYVQTILKRLSETGFAQRLFLPRASQRGSSPSVYTPARRGLNYLKAQGVDVASRYRPAEEREHSYLFLKHTLALNDVLIAAELLCRQFPQFGLETVLHERVLKHQPVYVQSEQGRKVAVIPDAWLDLRIRRGARQQQMCLVLELDQGTVEEKKWRRKARSLVAYASGPYQERFKTDSITVAVVATPGKKRAYQLLRWTELEMEGVGRAEADLFRFAGFSPEVTDPEEMFLSPRWYRAFDDSAVPLLDGLG